MSKPVLEPATAGIQDKTLNKQRNKTAKGSEKGMKM
jgi:hypothetical protein